MADPKDAPKLPESGEDEDDLQLPIDLEQPIEPGDADAQPT